MLNNTIEWKTYKAANLFGKSTLAKYHSPDTLIEDSNGYEYICATNKNNGINQSLSIVNGNNLSLTPKKIISWGKQCPNFTYHENECVTCQGVYYIQTNSISKYAAQFLCTIFNNICKNKFNYSNCLIGSKFDNLQIKLPSILKLTPDFESLGKIVGGGYRDE